MHYITFLTCICLACLVVNNKTALRYCTYKGRALPCLPEKKLWPNIDQFQEEDDCLSMTCVKKKRGESDLVADLVGWSISPQTFHHNLEATVFG